MITKVIKIHQLGTMEAHQKSLKNKYCQPHGGAERKVSYNKWTFCKQKMCKKTLIVFQLTETFLKSLKSIEILQYGALNNAYNTSQILKIGGFPQFMRSSGGQKRRH